MMEDRAANAMRPSLRILAVALDSLGDMVLREPLFDALASGGHQLTLVVRQGQGAVGHLVGHDAQVLELPFNPYKTDWPTCEPLLIQWMESIDLARFDVLLSTQFDRTHVDAALALRMPSARHVRFVHAAELHGDEAYGATPRWVAVASRDEHEWTKASRLAHAVLGDIEWRAPILAVSADARREAESFLAQWLLRADAFVVCCPSSTSNDLQKRMPAQLAADGLTELYSKYLFPALLVGLPHEGDDLRAVAEILMKRGTPVAIWMGDPQRPDLLAAIIEQSRCFFGIDGGSMHVAAALRKPVLAVLGGGHYPRFTPVVEPSYLMTQRLPCFDCAWKCWLQRPACIDLVSPEAVRRGVEWVVEGNGVYVDEGLSAGDELLSKLVAQGQRDGGLAENRRLRLELDMVNADRAARLRVIESLAAQVEAQKGSEGHTSTAHGSRADDGGASIAVLAPEPVAQLAHELEEANADRAARLEQIHVLTRELERANADRQERLEQVQTLTRLVTRADVPPLAQRALGKVNRVLDRVLSRIAHGPAEPALPSITLVTPVRNGAATIGATIESVLMQEYPRLQYIIVDGGSTDSTLEIVRSYCARDDLPQRIASVVSEPDEGMYDAIAKGFAQATGEVLGYLNADDLLERGALPSVGNYFAAHPRASVVYHEDCVWTNGWKFPNAAQPRWVGPWDLMARHILFQDGVFFRRRAYEAVGGVRRNLRLAGDFDLWLRLSGRFRFHRRDGHVTTFRMRPGQLSEDFPAYRTEMDAVLADWRHRSSALRLLAWSVTGVLVRALRRIDTALRRRTLFFPLDVKNLPPPVGDMPPAAMRHVPRSPIDGRAPQRLLFSATDTRFGERTVSHVYLDEDHHLAIVYPPLEASALDALYRRHYSAPADLIVEPPPDQPSPYRGCFGGRAWERVWWQPALRRATANVELSFDEVMLPEILHSLARVGVGADRAVRFLDVGCFEGHLLERLRASTRWTLFGLEPNARAAALAASRGLTVWSGHAENALFAVPSESLFDVIYLGQSIEHVDDPLLVLRRLRQLLMPGGVILLSTPNLDAKQLEWFGPTWAHWHLPYHRHIFSPAAVRHLARHAGLRVEYLRTFSHAHWTAMSIVQNRLGLAGVVSHAATMPEDVSALAKHLTRLSKLLWDRWERGDDLFAVLKDGNG